MEPRTTDEQAPTDEAPTPAIDNTLREILEVLGIACIVAAAFLVAPELGLLVLGVALIVVGSFA